MLFLKTALLRHFVTVVICLETCGLDILEFRVRGVRSTDEMTSFHFSLSGFFLSLFQHSGTASQSHSFDFVGFNKVDTLKMATPDSETSPERNERSDSFVVDMESLCRGIDKDVTANSRITVRKNMTDSLGSCRFHVSS
uniref:Uncharacterized protein n=1 Tax=Nelumbo nucifera TaxID=4432 RepID=A0A822Y0W4_NELNU|nr:TPA_asm: hypothetical protein HUJ06_024741 [Nelumbo nucifera]